MDKNEQKRREEELDRFWNIDALMPTKHSVRSTRLDVDAVEIVDDQKMPNRAESNSKTHFIPPHSVAERPVTLAPDEEYTPSDSLLQTVRIFRHKSNYAYYETFINDARRLYSVCGQEAPHVPFFSYVPQYTQMRREQLEWYLWWRENFRAGNVLPTDYSYLLLHTYEIINLGAHINPKEGQKALCDLWLQYRQTFHQLDSYLPEWICDYSLLHRLPPPEWFDSEATNLAMLRCTLKEFYISSGKVDGIIQGLLIFASNYDYHKSKFCTPENRVLFDRVIPNALREVFLRMGGPEGAFFNAGAPESSRLVREAYAGALCASRVKRRIAVEYTSLTCSQSIRYLVTDVIKYSENALRAHLGIRSRLGIYALPVSVRQLLDAYLAPYAPQKARTVKERREEEQEREYAHLYDLPRKPLSLGNASAIEQSSWDTTKRLVEAFDEEDPTAPDPLPESISDPEPQKEAPPLQETAIPVCYHPFLRAAAVANAQGLHSAARALGKMVDAVADEINELAAEVLGDILLEEQNGTYRIIEDYLSWAEEQLITGKDA